MTMEQQPVQAGELVLESGETHILYSGCNVVARARRGSAASSIKRNQEFRNKWAQFENVTGIFLSNDTLSGEHALICMETTSAPSYVIFLEDLRSRNKTYVHDGASRRSLRPGERTRVESGAAATFGNMKCRLMSFPVVEEKLTMTPVIEDEEETLALEGPIDTSGAEEPIAKDSQLQQVAEPLSLKEGPGATTTVVPQGGPSATTNTVHAAVPEESLSDRRQQQGVARAAADAVTSEPDSLADESAHPDSRAHTADPASRHNAIAQPQNPPLDNAHGGSLPASLPNEEPTAVSPSAKDGANDGAEPLLLDPELETLGHDSSDEVWMPETHCRDGSVATPAGTEDTQPQVEAAGTTPTQCAGRELRSTEASDEFPTATTESKFLATAATAPPHTAATAAAPPAPLLSAAASPPLVAATPPSASLAPPPSLEATTAPPPSAALAQPPSLARTTAAAPPSVALAPPPSLAGTTAPPPPSAALAPLPSSAAATPPSSAALASPTAPPTAAAAAAATTAETATLPESATPEPVAKNSREFLDPAQMAVETSAQDVIPPSDDQGNSDSDATRDSGEAPRGPPITPPLSSGGSRGWRHIKRGTDTNKQLTACNKPISDINKQLSDNNEHLSDNYEHLCDNKQLRDSTGREGGPAPSPHSSTAAVQASESPVLGASAMQTAFEGAGAAAALFMSTQEGYLDAGGESSLPNAGGISNSAEDAAGKPVVQTRLHINHDSHGISENAAGVTEVAADEAAANEAVSDTSTTPATRGATARDPTKAQAMLHLNDHPAVGDIPYAATPSVPAIGPDTQAAVNDLASLGAAPTRLPHEPPTGGRGKRGAKVKAAVKARTSRNSGGSDAVAALAEAASAVAVAAPPVSTVPRRATAAQRTGMARRATTAVATGRGERPDALTLQEEQEGSPAPTPASALDPAAAAVGLRAPDRRRKPRSEAKPEVEGGAGDPDLTHSLIRRSRTPLEARLPRGGGVIASSRRSRSRSASLASLTPLPQRPTRAASVRGKKRQASASPTPEPHTVSGARSASRNATPDIQAARPSNGPAARRGRSLLGAKIDTTPTPETAAAHTAAILPASGRTPGAVVQAREGSLEGAASETANTTAAPHTAGALPASEQTPGAAVQARESSQQGTAAKTPLPRSVRKTAALDPDVAKAMTPPAVDDNEGGKEKVSAAAQGSKGRKQATGTARGRPASRRTAPMKAAESVDGETASATSPEDPVVSAEADILGSTEAAHPPSKKKNARKRALESRDDGEPFEGGPTAIGTPLPIPAVGKHTAAAAASSGAKLSKPQILDPAPEPKRRKTKDRPEAQTGRHGKKAITQVIVPASTKQPVSHGSSPSGVDTIKSAVEDVDCLKEPLPATQRRKAAANRRRSGKLDSDSSPTEATERPTLDQPAGSTVKAEGGCTMTARPSGPRAKGAALKSKQPARRAVPVQSPAEVVLTRRRQPGSDIVVRFSSNVGKAVRDSSTACIRAIGGTITEDDIDFSHLVVMPRTKGSTTGFVKSLSSLMALAAGRPIVTPEWATAAADAKTSRTTMESILGFLLVDKVAEKTHGFSLARSYEAAQAGLLLADTHVYVTEALSSSEADGGKGVVALIEAAGGLVVQSAAQLANTAHALVICHAEAAALETKKLKGKVPAGTRMYGRKALVDAILKQDRTFGSVGALVKR